MTSIRITAALSTLVALCACDPDRWGTQIGTEDTLTCEVVSTDVLTDLDAVPDDFTLSPNAMLDGLVNTYSGEQTDGEQGDTGEGYQPNGLAAELVVANPGGDVVLTRTLPDFSEEDLATLDDDDLVRICPPFLTTTLSYTLTAEGLPVLQTDLATNISPDAWARTGFAGEDGYASALPSPSEFDPDDFGHVEADTSLYGTAAQWSVTASWLAWNPEDAAADGDVAKTRELLVLATLDAE
jgi:hypothetical protein